MRHGAIVLLCALLTGLMALGATAAEVVYVRANQVGYLPGDPKVAIAFSGQPLRDARFEVVDATTGRRVWGPYPVGANAGAWGNFPFHYRLDFSQMQAPGRFKVKISGTRYESLPFSIGPEAYEGYHELVIGYMQQQRCGYNPFLDEVCHRKDARTVYGPMPDGTYLDVSGGWHDAGDHLRYLLTSGNAVGRLLFSYRQNKGKFADKVDQWGHASPNGVPDVLDEARWGLDWMLKMHPAPDQLFHQVADDRDHIGFKMPYADSADYGYGPGSYRVVYYATGAPQGLGEFQNTSTGIANLAGRYAAAMAMAADIWQRDLGEQWFAARCLQAAREVYEMGRRQPGCQEGTPCRAPYRYHERTWADDMEWGAAELFRVTGEERYRDDARTYARLANTVSWMGADTAHHYEFYPFMNLGHYALWQVAEDEALRDTLAAYYRQGIEAVWQRAQKNPYHIGIPFIWCSNNLAAAFVTQCLLYEAMTGDSTYHLLMTETRDWLLGRNPWGVSQFVGIPRQGGQTPQFPHSAISLHLGRAINGALNDGPVYASIFNSLKGIRLSREDPYAPFQSDLVVYHDDTWDYATNEPTLDGTAEAHYFLAHLAPVLGSASGSR